MKFISSTIALLLATSAVSAAGFEQPAPEVVVTPTPAPAPAVDWTGAYVGGSLGFGEVGGTTNVEDQFDDSDLEADFDVSLSDTGLNYGAHAGYNFQNGPIVYGVEAAIFSNTAEVKTNALSPSEAQGLDLDYAARLVGKLGYASGDLLVYGTAGFANARMNVDGDDLATFLETDDFSGSGYAVGFGADYMLNDSIVVGGEYNYHRFNDFFDEGILTDVEELDAEISTWTLKASYRF